jgi:hypothetical protein
MRHDLKLKTDNTKEKKIFYKNTPINIFYFPYSPLSQ